VSLQGDPLFLKGLGYRADAFVHLDRPRFFDEEGDDVNRAEFLRSGVDVALRVSLQRWGLLEAGLRLGEVSTRETPGIELPDADDSTRTFFAAVVIDRLDDLLWPTAGQRLRIEGWRSSESLGATWPFWRLWGEGRLGQGLGHRTVLQFDALVGLSGEGMPIYDWFRVGGPYLLPGYHHEELKGPQALVGAVAVRYRIAGSLRALVRVGAGNVYATRSDITLDDLRWGIGLGIMSPSPIGPLALELGWRESGASLLSVSLGWN
jgi:outer membrane translocation and assembly module TamA